MDTNQKLLSVFLEVQRGLPRQGPGNHESTLQALGLCSDLPSHPTILDIGCGPGMQTVALAEACSGRITAVDTCEEYLDQLLRRAQQAKVADRVEIVNADMANLGLPPSSFDLIWCEGAAYIMGVAAALASWRSLLREQGYLAFSELIWLDENPDDSLAEFWRAEYPAMTSVKGVRKEIQAAGYQPVGDFSLPDSAWWTDYYAPLEAKLPALRKKFADDAEALSLISSIAVEIDMRRRFSHAYAYQFFIVRRVG